MVNNLKQETIDCLYKNYGHLTKSQLMEALSFEDAIPISDAIKILRGQSFYKEQTKLDGLLTLFLEKVSGQKLSEPKDNTPTENHNVLASRASVVKQVNVNNLTGDYEEISNTKESFMRVRQFLSGNDIKDELALPYVLSEIAGLTSEHKLIQKVFLNKAGTVRLTDKDHNQLLIKYIPDNPSGSRFYLYENAKTKMPISYHQIGILMQIHYEKTQLQNLEKDKMIRLNSKTNKYELSDNYSVKEFNKFMIATRLDLISNLTDLRSIIEQHLQNSVIKELLKTPYLTSKKVDDIEQYYFANAVSQLSLKDVIASVGKKMGLNLNNIPWMFVKSCRTSVWDKVVWNKSNKVEEENYNGDIASRLYPNDRYRIRSGDELSFVTPTKHLSVAANHVFISPDEVKENPKIMSFNNDILLLHKIPDDLKPLNTIQIAEEFKAGFYKWFFDTFTTPDKVNEYLEMNPNIWNAKELPNIYCHVHCAESAMLLLVQFAWLNGYDLPIPISDNETVLISDFDTFEQLIEKIKRINASQYRSRAGMKGMFKVANVNNNGDIRPGFFSAIKRQVNANFHYHVQGAVIMEQFEGKPRIWYYMGQVYRLDYQNTEMINFEDSINNFQILEQEKFIDILEKIEYKLPGKILSDLKKQYGNKLTKSIIRNHIKKIMTDNLTASPENRKLIFTRQDKALLMFYLSDYPLKRRMEEIAKDVRSGYNPEEINQYIMESGGSGAKPEATQFLSYHFKVNEKTLEQIKELTEDQEQILKKKIPDIYSYLIKEKMIIEDELSEVYLNRNSDFKKWLGTIIRDNDLIEKIANFIGDMYIGDEIEYVELNPSGIANVSREAITTRT